MRRFALALSLLLTPACADPGSTSPDPTSAPVGFGPPPSGASATDDPDPASTRPGTEPDTDSGNESGNEPGTSPSDPTPPPSATEPVGLTCEGLYTEAGNCYGIYYDCAGPCADQACADACESDYNGCVAAAYDGASSQAQSAFDALRACEDDNWQSCYDEGGVVYQNCAGSCTDDACQQACNDEATSVLRGCLESSCQARYDACGVATGGSSEPEPEPEPTTPPTTGGDYTCAQLYDCEDACHGDQACGQACYDKGSDSAQSQWNNLIQCGISWCNGQVANAQEYKACLASMCPSEYGTCFEGAAAPPTQGSETCGGGYACVQGCFSTASSESAFNGCLDGCYASINGTAQTLLQALSACADNECSGVPGSIDNYFQCVQDYCPNQYQACMAQPG